jgi:hypothetical protein
MDDFLVKYFVAWVACSALGVALFVKDIRLSWRDEARFLLVPWKVALFGPAVVFVTFAGRYTDDETWDVTCGGGMAVLTVLTSGWSVGTVVKGCRGERPPSHLVVALIVALFSSSWFYDGYLLWRDGAYTHRWLGNLTLSPVIYACAGVVMNLEATSRGVGFAFLRRDWPRSPLARVSPGLAAAVLPLVLVAAYVLVAFVGWSVP